MTAARTAKKLKNESKVTESLPTISESSRESSSRNKRPNCDFYHSLETPEKEEKSGGDETYGQLELDFAPPQTYWASLFCQHRLPLRPRDKEREKLPSSVLWEIKSPSCCFCVSDIRRKYQRNISIQKSLSGRWHNHFSSQSFFFQPCSRFFTQVNYFLLPGLAWPSSL